MRVAVRESLRGRGSRRVAVDLLAVDPRLGEHLSLGVGLLAL